MPDDAELERDPPTPPAPAAPPRARPTPGGVIVPARSADAEAEDAVAAPRGLPAYWPSATLPDFGRWRVLGRVATLAAVGGAGVLVGRLTARPAEPIGAEGMRAASAVVASGPVPEVLPTAHSDTALPESLARPTADVPSSVGVAATGPRRAPVTVATGTRGARRASVRAAAAPLAARPAAPAPSAGERPASAALTTLRGTLRRTIAEYAAAIETRDVNRVARAYPGLQSSERASWEKFFGDVTSVDARLAVADVRQISDVVAEARVTGTYDFRTRERRRGRQGASFRALFGREPGGAWRLVEIR